MTAVEAIIAIATIATRMNIFFLFLEDFSEGDRDDKRSGVVKQYNTKDIEYNR
jgi:hypothetical protein